MADVNIAKAPANDAVLPFYATGALAFLALCVLLLVSPQSLQTHFFNPHLLSIVHTAALGWGTMVIFGAAHQLLPVICEQDLYSERMASFCWYTLTTGIALFVFSFWDMRTGWLMITGGALVVLSVLLFVINVLLTSRICTRYSVQKMLIVSSSLWLLFTVVVGLLLAVNLAFPFFTRSHLDILKLHAHAGIAGWFLQLITGVSAKLVPMFLLGKAGEEKWLKYACLFQNAGLLLFLADGYLNGVGDRSLLYGALILAGVLCWMRYLWTAYKSRLRKKVDVMMKHTAFSFCCLLIAFALLPWVLYAQGSRWAMLYGSFIFLGWITGIILGKSFKTLPFIVWNGHYKHLSGKVKVPLPKHLYNERMVEWQLPAFVVALFSLALALILDNLLLIRLSLVSWLIVALLYNINVFKTLLHKTKTLE